MFMPLFGLKDNPFKLAFDVNHLFLGKHHEEALAHLRYALAEGEGFTVITGANGVGKSTVCRAFVEMLKGEATAAFLSSPINGPQELLQRMNRSFGISAKTQTIHELTGALNRFLMRARVVGQKVVALIDDAQFLDPAVLEQVRLISNLETTREKLIQIVLIGEPALMQVLNSVQLRQMGQRVSVCYEIGPLTLDETAAYIQHRLSAASAEPSVRFSREAVREIYQHTHGNPRRINIACGAIMAAAFKAHQKEITGELAQAVIQDRDRLNGRSVTVSSPRRWPAWALASSGLLLLGAAAFFTIRPAPAPPSPEAVFAKLPVTATPVPEEPAHPSGEGDHAGAVPPATLPLPQTPPEPKPTLPAGSKPAAMTHSVQVGAYVQPENARQMAAQLNARGYSAQVLEITDARGRIWHIVRIGDHPSRQEAQEQANGFSQREKRPSVVRPFGKF
jgi:type II secretory pathway predicted ATPase ExeA